jgi:methionyl-tRNA synthetase
VSADEDEALIALAKDLPARVDAQMTDLHIPDALAEIWKLVARCNKYIDVTAPWSLAKTDEGKERLKTVLYNLAECLRIVGVLLIPFLTSTPNKMFVQLGVSGKNAEFDAVAWGGSIPAQRSARAKRFSAHRRGKGAGVPGRAHRAGKSSRRACRTGKTAEPAKKGAHERKNPGGDRIRRLCQGRSAACQGSSLRGTAQEQKAAQATLDVGGEERTVVSGIKKWYSQTT